jgi:hypothetical protein
MAITTFSILDSYIHPFCELRNTFRYDGYFSHAQYFFIYFLTVEHLGKKSILFRTHAYSGKITRIFGVIYHKEIFFWIYCFSFVLLGLYEKHGESTDDRSVGWSVDWINYCEVLASRNGTMVIWLLYRSRIRDSSTGIAAGYGLDNRRVGVRVPIRSRNCSLFHRV